jgi:hypothetical protein
MKNRFRFIFGAFITILFVGSLLTAGAQTRRKTTPAPAPAALAPNPLIQMLPDSDGVVVFNAKKFLNVGLPQILGVNSAIIGRVNTEIDNFKKETSLDVRQFEIVAAGLKYKEISPTMVNVEPVVLMRGQFDGPALLALVKLASKGKFREEQVNGKTICIFPASPFFTDEVKKNLEPVTNEKPAEMKVRVFGGEIAAGMLDDKTLALGSVERVRETFSGTSTLSADMRAQLSIRPGSVVSFSGKVPEGLAKMFGLDTEEVAKMIDSMKTIHGYVDMNGTTASLMIAGKTTTAEEAMTIEDTVTGLKELGKALINNSRGAEKLFYTRLINNAKITRVETQVQLNIFLSQADMDFLSRKF